MLDFLCDLKRTHMCGELRASDAGSKVVLMGWVNKRRDLGKRRVAGDEMLAEVFYLGAFGMQHRLFARLEGNFRSSHRQRRGAPQQHKQRAEHAAFPDSAEDQSGDDGEARHQQADAAKPPEHDQIRIVEVGAGEQQQEAEQPER